MTTEMVLRHPVETILQYALLLSIPIGNSVVWNRLKHKNLANVLRLGLLNGLAAGTSALIAAGSLARTIMSHANGWASIDTTDLTMYGTVASLSLLASVYLMRSLTKVWETDGAKSSQLVYSLAGVLLSLLTIGTTEGRQVAIRVAEHQALSEDHAQRDAAMNVLRFPLLDAQQELKRDIAAPRSGGISGMFLPLDTSARRQLYFALTARPYESIADLSAEDRSGDTIVSTAYDNFLAAHVVGDTIKGLSLKRSQIRGAVSAKTLTSNLEWSMVLKNKSEYHQEARAEIALPPGAVVSNMTLWIDGNARQVAFTSNATANSVYTNATSNGENHASVIYLGKGRVLLQCYPVQPNREIKLSLTMVAPLKLDQASQASLALPRLVASNFAPSKTHDLRFLSDGNLTLPSADLHPAATAGDAKLFVGAVKDEDKNTGLSLVASRPATLGAFAARSFAPDGYTVETVKEIPNNAPKNLVVVIDGSKSVREFKKDITTMLGKVEKLMPTSVLLADSDSTEAPAAVTVGAAIKQLEGMSFEGGHDNLPAVVKAAELAGDQNNSAVLWIHGPQPAFNEEIYITSQGASKPAFYELALDDGWTNTSEFFKNHQDIGPMVPIMRSGKLGDDLNRFLSQWQPGGHHYSVQLSNLTQKPNCPELTGEEAVNLSVLGAAHAVKQMIAAKQPNASLVAAAYHIVSPLSSGVIMPESYTSTSANAANATVAGAERTAINVVTSNDSLNGFGNAEPAPIAVGNGAVTIGQNGTAAIAIYGGGTGTAPMLQGATNGIIGPQGSDCTVIQGVNTAGTVRVNNLANIETALTILANSAELLGLVLGGGTIVSALMKGFKGRRFAYGVAMIMLGLATPGILNWFVASGRDSGLFN
jgi:hypothetical protein